MSYSKSPKASKVNSPRRNFKSNKPLVEHLVPLRQAPFCYPENHTPQTKTIVHFIHQKKSYRLTCSGRPGTGLISHLSEFVYAAGEARSSSESIWSYRRSGKSSDSSETVRRNAKSSSSSAGSRAASVGRKVYKKVFQTFSQRSSPQVPAEGRRESTPSTESISDSRLSEPIPSTSKGRFAQKQRSSSSRSTPCKSTSGAKGVSPAKRPREYLGQSHSLEYIKPSFEKQLYLWDTETIPVQVIYSRAGFLYQAHVQTELRKQAARRKFKPLDSFVDSAEEDLVRERLTLELYSAERIPTDSAPYGQNPYWLNAVYSFRREHRKLVKLLASVNEIRLTEDKPKLDSFVEYYWDLNRRGFASFSLDREWDETLVYAPSFYREKILAEDLAASIRRDHQFSSAHNPRTPPRSSPRSPRGNL